MKGKGLWTRDYTRITLASILSIIGGEAINLPVSLLVFDETKSTLLSALVMMCGFLPDLLLGVLVAPVIDRSRKKRWIVGMDALLLGVYLAMAAFTHIGPFHYGLYVAFTLVTATVSVFYRLAYSAWFPDLIPSGCEQQGYAVSGTLYPLISIVMSPVAAFLYTQISVPNMFLGVAALLALSIAVEAGIREDGAQSTGERYTLRKWRSDLAAGFQFIRREKGIRNIYTYMSFASASGESTAILIRAYFQTAPGLSVTMLGLMSSAEMIGRLISGAAQYRFTVPPKRRYGVTRFVYVFYQLMDMLLLFMPYGAMLANRFACGALGTLSATLRSTAVNSYLPADLRARVNALFDTMGACAMLLFELLAGVLGQALAYRTGVALISGLTLLAAVALILLPAKVNRPVYEATRR